MQEYPQTLIGRTTAEVREAVTAAGLPAYRGSQVGEWLYRRTLPGEGGGFGADFAAMTDLPQTARAELAARFGAPVLIPGEQRTDRRDETVKILARLADGGHPIECVLLPDERRVSVCLSTQAGCPMACAFCATGTQGLTRNLSAAEIVAQFLLLQSRSARRISHVVLMGMGEPLLNYENTLKAIRILSAECGIAMRHITLSTVGIVPQMDRLAQENLQITLAVSLHAPTDELRRRLVPVAKTYPLDRLMDTCRRYAAHTHRRLTFEYVLLREVNDRPEEARELAALLRGVPAAVNLIPYNPTAVAEPFQRPGPERIAAFRKILEQAGLTVTQRKERGRQIAAACGQLVTEATRRTPKKTLPVLAGVA
ncbi:MAG: 23S rRNA (adenine(2503)-C(2))-methyltransferase RlmN [Armatimonadetes bacterium]|nr:23S rRNA (adenine(2503)-C(2))-methyltransferase RlmN [Armatimonadota bacterium]